MKENIQNKEIDTEKDIPETTSIELEVLFSGVSLGCLERLASSFLVVSLLLRIPALVCI